MYLRPFQLSSLTGNTASITVGTTSAKVAIKNAGIGNRSLLLTNAGTAVVFFRLATSTTDTADTTDTPLLANTSMVVFLPNNVTEIAAIAAATGSVLYATTGESE